MCLFFRQLLIYYHISKHENQDSDDLGKFKRGGFLALQMQWIRLQKGI
jgi:hypothetical protein